jgi:hypothetical protein
MIDIVFPEFSVRFDDFHPDVHGFYFIPAIVLRLLAILHDIEQTGLEVLKYHDKGIHSTPAHDEVIH